MLLKSFAMLTVRLCIPFWREMTSHHLTLRQPECNFTGNDVTSPLTRDSQIQPYCQNGCHLADYIVSNVRFLAPDTGFSGRISVFWRAEKIFPCQHLDLNLS